MRWAEGAPPPVAEAARVLLNGKRQRNRWTRKQANVEAELPEVIAWDGEGWGDLDHRYVLLANSLGHEVRDEQGLSTLRCLDLVWRGAQCRPRAINVIFGGTYDFNNWLRDINLETARSVNAGRLVQLRPYRFRYNGNWFEIERANRLVKVWDVWRFWGTRFDLALEECLPDFHGLATIKEMKQQRGEFHAGMLEEMSRYNHLELEALVLMVNQLFRDLIEARIRRPTYLTGAGALAGSLLNQYGVLDHNRLLPDEVQRASLVGYFGGRIEPWQVGTYRGTVYQADIRNAYCYALAALPTLRAGRWEWVAGNGALTAGWEGRLSVWNVAWRWDVQRDHLADETASYFPFPYRHRTGTVCYPNWGQGWYWWPEVVTAQELGWGFEVTGGWVWRSDDEALPFGWVPGLFRHRMALKAAGRVGAAREVKFAMNALYGKLCQAKGHPSWDPPAHHNLAWAGWVTSHCRAQLMSAVHQKPWAVLYVMTDSVASTEPLTLPLGDDLGQWELTEYEGAQVVQAGVATLWKDGVASTEKYRGFDAGSITPDLVEAAWRANHATNRPDPVKVKVRRPVNLGSALTAESRFDLWNRWITADRELDLYGGGGKRWRYWDVNTHELWREAAPLAAWSPVLPYGDLWDLPLSADYQPKWTDAKRELDSVVVGSLRDREVEELRAAELA